MPRADRSKVPEERDPVVFALSTDALGERVAAVTGMDLSPHEERRFDDGEHKARPLVPVRGRDVYVIDSLHGGGGLSVNDRLCRLLFFCGALGESSAASVTAVLPYLCYARKDRQTKPRDPVTTRYVAMLVEAVGVDHVMALDVHDLAAFQNAFRCRTDHLTARLPLARRVAERLDGAPITVVSPDAGGVKRANPFRIALSDIVGAPVASAFAEKRRSGGVVTGDLLAGDLEGRAAVIVDDLISSGGTMARTARRCLEFGATRVLAVATHGVFAARAEEALGDPAIEGVLVTDSVELRALSGPAGEKLDVVTIAPLLAEAIHRVHLGESLVELLGSAVALQDRREAP
jgi:ribose-phosphate pyrophosphokinase